MSRFFLLKVATLAAGVLAGGAALAVPQLKSQAEVIGGGELKAKVLQHAEGVPAPTPQSKKYKITRGSVSEQVVYFVPRDLWYQRAFVGEWKDKKGNVMRIGRVKSLVPKFDREDYLKEEIEKALDKLEEEFKAEDADLDAWKSVWGPKGEGGFVKTKKAVYFYEFLFKEPIKPADQAKLFKTFEKSVSVMTGGSSSTNSSMKWWEEKNPQYLFLTDLDKAKGQKFIKDAMRLMEAMRKAYEFYVPAKNEVGVGKVRVFKTLAGYREYRASTGDEDKKSCGLWDPSREELLIAAEDPKQAQSTMRHEAFHQYLHYATGNGHHATWFNEGHATFFENVEYNPSKNTVKVVDKGNRATWVEKSPKKIAGNIRAILKMTQKEFYSGDSNLNYCTAWALMYFLEKGAYTADEFEPYRAICAKYLELTASGMEALKATQEAWAPLADRDVAADFLKFWTKYRKRAANAR